MSKYEVENKNFQETFQFNWREYQTYLMIKKHKAEFDQFNTYVNQECLKM